MSDAPSKISVIVSWASYCLSFTHLVLFEKVQFNMISWTMLEYGVLAGGLIGGYVGCHALARRAPWRWTLIALLACNLIVAAVSFSTFWVVPLGVATFTCPATEFGCGVAGQVILCITILGGFPPLLARLSRDSTREPRKRDGLPALVTMLTGAALIATGLPAAAQPAWAPLGAWIGSIAGCISVIALSVRGDPAPVPSRPQPRGGLVAVRSTILMLVAGILGFAVMLPQSNPFTFMPGIGMGVLTCGALILLLERFVPRSNPEPVALLEGGLLAGVAMATFVAWWFVSAGSELRVLSGIHEFITGLILGFAWARHVRATAGGTYMPTGTAARLKGISSRGASTFWFFFLSFLVAAVALINIWPTSYDVIFLHGTGAVLCAVALVSWMASTGIACRKKVSVA